MALNKTSVSQYETMVDYMERNGDLLKPVLTAQGRVRAARNWEELTTLLNQDGSGCVKTVEKWKKVSVGNREYGLISSPNQKKKAATIIESSRLTGGGPNTSKPLSALEERVVAVIGERAISGGNVAERGFNTVQMEFLSVDAVAASQPVTYTTASQLVTYGAASQLGTSTAASEPGTDYGILASTSHYDVEVELDGYDNGIGVRAQNVEVHAEHQQPEQQQHRQPEQQQHRQPERQQPTRLVVQDAPRIMRRQMRRSAYGPYEKAAQMFGRCEEEKLKLEARRIEEKRTRDEGWLQLERERQELERKRLEDSRERNHRWLTLEELKANNEARNLALQEQLQPLILTALGEINKSLKDLLNK